MMEKHYLNNNECKIFFKEDEEKKNHFILLLLLNFMFSLTFESFKINYVKL